MAVLSERSEVKTLPLSGERVKHSSEDCFSGSPKFFQAMGYFFSVRSLTYQVRSLILKSLANRMILKYYLIQKFEIFGHAEGLPSFASSELKENCIRTLIMKRLGLIF